MTSLQPRTDMRETALCTVCGQTRKYRRPRNRVWRDDATCTRQVGDLKCANCGAITRHALITAEDFAEDHERVALGMPPANANLWTDEQRERFQDQYRRNVLQRNPRLCHIWYSRVEAEAIKHGQPTMRALCGEMVKTPKRAEDTNNVPHKELDPNTYSGPSWDGSETDADGWEYRHCVNCLRVHNYQELVRQRDRLKVLMTTALAELLDPMRVSDYDRHLADLTALLERVHGDGGVQR